MHCLLCHEKIPRLRAWAGKSEFCCDEHAELYKKQTMDRLLVDDAVSSNAPPALPILDSRASAVSVDHILLKDQSKKAKRAKDAQEAREIDELWKLADRMGFEEKAAPSKFLVPGISNETKSAVPAQSAEEALAALQALAAGAGQDSAGADLLDELSNMESSFEELPQLESLPIDLAAEMGHGELDEAPELELDALEPADAQAEVCAKPELVAQATDLEAIDAPDLLLEGLAEAQQEALEPPELAADFAADQDESLEPPDAILQELLAASDASDEQNSNLADPPEPADFEIAAVDEAAAALPVAVQVARSAPKAAPKLRPATELHEMSPSPTFPEGGYALKPWSDALAIAGPDRSSLLGPKKFLEMRKSSLNGTASAKFDPVELRASERVAAVTVPILEPNKSVVSYSNHDGALTPRAGFAWPAPLHAALIAAEMNLNGALRALSADEATFTVKQPALSVEFLSRVALQSRILEPRRSAILSPRERDVFASAAVEEEESGSESASAAGRSDRDETEGGERAHVADLF